MRFLSGVTEEMLGVHRFNPYRQILKAEVFSVARELKAVGYRTVCIHPYSASFYGRDKVYPHLGFDEFIDDRSFVGAERFGPYISDRAVAEKAKSLIASADGPIFVFLITMENHGPLHLEKPDESDYAALYSELPPSGCEDLTVYLRHLRNADRMMGGFESFLRSVRPPLVSAGTAITFQLCHRSIGSSDRLMGEQTILFGKIVHANLGCAWN